MSNPGQVRFVLFLPYLADASGLCCLKSVTLVANQF